MNAVGKIEYTYFPTIYSRFSGIPDEEANGLIKTIKFTYENENPGESPKMQYRLRNSDPWINVPTSAYTCDLVNKRVVFDIYKIYEQSGIYDWQFSIGGENITGVDPRYTSISSALNNSWLSLDFQVQGDYSNYDLVAEVDGGKNFFKEKIFVQTPIIAPHHDLEDNWSLLYYDATPALKEIKIIFTSPTGKISTSSLPITYKDSSTKIYTIPINIQTGMEIEIIITNELGKETFNYSYGPFSRADELQKIPDSFYFVDSIRPYSNTNGITNVVPISGIPNGSNNVKFEYVFSIGSYTKVHETSYNQNNGNQVYFSYEYINKLLIELANLKGDTNNNHTVNLKLSVSSGFEKIDFTTSFKANFIESPTFIDNNNTALSIDGVGPDDLSEPRMFNFGETITFIIPSFTDPNNDISTCIIEVARTDLTMNLDSDISNLNNASYSILDEYEYDENSYEYTLPFYSKNEILRFRARVKDEKGNFSEYSNASTYIIACRTTNPTFSANNFRIEGNTIDFNFQIDDLGGSAPASGWDPNFYEEYRNFERTIQDDGKKLELTVKLTNSDNITEERPPIERGSMEGYIGFSGDKSIAFTIEKTDIMYLQLTLTIYYGKNNQYVQTTSSIYTLGNVPTVSYRPNHIGINTNQLDSKGVLTIKKYQDYKFIVLQLDNRNLTINLETGEINGANISGGSW